MATPLVSALVTPRRALVLPVDDSFAPWTPLYAQIVDRLRKHVPRLDVFGYAVPLGIVSHRRLIDFPELIRGELPTTEREAARETAVRVRAWMDSRGPSYHRIVLLSHGPTMPVWSRAVRKCDTNRRVRVVTHPSNQRLSTNVFRPLRSALVGE